MAEVDTMSWHRTSDTERVRQAQQENLPDVGTQSGPAAYLCKSPATIDEGRHRSPAQTCAKER